MQVKTQLKNILAWMKEKADQSPGNYIKMTLTNGLEIIIKKVGNNYHMGIAREKIQPSLIEWETIEKNCPFKTRTRPIVFKKQNKTFFHGIYKS